MPIYDSKGSALFKELRAASYSEEVATKNLYAYIKSGGTDNAEHMRLVDLMTSAHNEKTESPRELRRLLFLREWSHEQDEQVFP